jgi:hypothetical protein
MDDIHLARLFIQRVKTAKDRGIEFSLSFTSLKNIYRAKKCYYTGITLTKCGQGDKTLPTDVTIDRKDPTKGYVKGNVVACSHLANSMKNGVEHDPVRFKAMEGIINKMKKEGVVVGED